MRAGDGAGAGPGLGFGEIPGGTTIEITLDPPDDVPCGNEVHAAGKIAWGDVDAQMVRAVAFIAIAEGADAGTPATAA